jgi:hypothetical protein
MLRDTPPNDLIRTILEKIRIVLEKVLHHGHKLGHILLPLNATGVVYQGFVSNVHCSSGKVVLEMGVASSVKSIVILDR